MPAWTSSPDGANYRGFTHRSGYYRGFTHQHESTGRGYAALDSASEAVCL